MILHKLYVKDEILRAENQPLEWRPDAFSWYGDEGGPCGEKKMNSRLKSSYLSWSFIGDMIQYPEDSLHLQTTNNSSGGPLPYLKVNDLP